MKTLVAGLALMVASVVISTGARAQRPAMISDVWTPPALAYNDCMQRAAAALRQAGTPDAKEQTIFAGMGFVTGGLGDYSATIMCITFKGVVVFSVAGLDGPTADNYRKQLNVGMGKR